MREETSRIEIWVCHGRMCTGGGADALAARARDGAALAAGRCQVLRGGCYGLCELGPNLVVREGEAAARSDQDADRLVLTGDAGETVYCGLVPADVDRIIRAHAAGQGPVPELTREVREVAQPARSEVAARLRGLRRRRRQPIEVKK
ncbi:MAG: (2Fe-2S) ferredoxin domain-containing protein [Deltaproteobacteria bacterium]|nr:(2Fe-2S) ferredoxin domain-containing protein [Deltaproteobacteria bacterium]